MRRWVAGLWVIGALVVAPAAAWAGADGVPAVVTTARGPVQLVDGGAAGELPALPLLLAAGQGLELGEGAMAVVLCGGSARKLAGPVAVSLEELQKGVPEAAAQVGALNDLLSRKTSTARTAASRGGGELTLVRPVPRTAILRLGTIRWECGDCGVQEVQVYDFRADETLWTGSGEGSVEYDGPRLAPGAYYVVLGGRDFPFTVPPAEEAQRVNEAVEALSPAIEALGAGGEADLAAAISLPVTVFLQAEMPSMALYLLDDRVESHPDDDELIKLRDGIEKRAGLRP